MEQLLEIFRLAIFLIAVVIYCYLFMIPNTFCSIITVKTSFKMGLPQEELSDFPKLNVSDCFKLDYYDNGFPFYTSVYLEHHINQELIPLVDTGTDWSGRVQAQYIPTFYIEGVRLFYIKNGFLAMHRTIVSDYNHFIDIANSSVDMNKNKINNLNTTKGYRYVITSVSDWGWVFAHMFTDIFGPLIFVDESIWNLKPILILPDGIWDVGRLLLDAMGHSDIELMIVKDEIIYAENLFVAAGYARISPSGHYSIPALKKLIFKYYELEKNKPVNYGFMNKKVGWRHFYNLNDLIKIIEQEHNISFIFLSVNQPKQTEFIKTMSTLRIFVAPCGSIGFNCIYTHDGTGSLSLAAQILDMHQYHFAMDAKTWHVSVIHQYLYHWGWAGNASIPRCVNAFNILKYAVDHQKWPIDHHLFLPIDEQMYRKHGGHPPNFTQKTDDPIHELYSKYLKHNIHYNITI